MKNKKWIFGFFIMICFILTNRVFIQAETASSQTTVGVSYQAHVENIGWQPEVKNGDMAGTTGRNLRVEALKISIDNPLPNMKIRYRTHVENKGWLPYVYDGQVSGTTGESLRVEAIQVELEGAPDGYHVEYQVHVENIGWMDWVKDGQVAGTTGQGLKVEALRIKITNTNPNFILSYQGHVENIGWQPVVKSNDIAGTTGKDLRMEAVKISIDNPVANMKIKYRTHVENKGWLPYVYDGQVSGTTGEGLRIEAIQIELEGAPSGYHVEYQAHVENIGWMNWVEDGQIAGTTGQALKLEALRIRIVNYTELNTYKSLYANYSISLDDHVNLQYARGPVLGNTATKADINTINYYLNPFNFMYNEQRYQFMRLDGYSDIISEDDLNKFLSGKGVFEGQAKLFLDAARNNDINPIYLVAHAMWETAYGTSALSKGIFVTQVDGQPVEGKAVYNFFGIGAPDGNANRIGSENAYLWGWFTPKLAIDGGAQWIKNNYIFSTRTNQLQNTLYEMRWNYLVSWHQYATDVRWAYGITNVINQLLPYTRGANFTFEIPAYK